MTSLNNTVHGCYPDDFTIGDNRKIFIPLFEISQRCALAFLNTADKALKVKPPTEPDCKYMDKAFTVVKIDRPQGLDARLVVVYKTGITWWLLTANFHDLREWNLENDGTPFSEFLEKIL